MKMKRFTEEQIIGILKEADAGTPVTELCRSLGCRIRRSRIDKCLEWRERRRS